MTVGFLRSYSQLVIRTCHKREVHAMGGMAAQIPIKNNPDANNAAIEKVGVQSRPCCITGCIWLYPCESGGSAKNAKFVGKAALIFLGCIRGGLELMKVVLAARQLCIEAEQVKMYMATTVYMTLLHVAASHVCRQQQINERQLPTSKVLTHMYAAHESALCTCNPR